jgi:tetratricopeptide (TPR) repeat protein
MNGSILRRLALWVTVCALACGLDPEARLEEVRESQRAGRFDATIEPLRELLRLSPDDPELNHLYGVALLGTGQPELAIWPLRKAAQDPERAVEDGLLLTRALLRGGSSADAVRQALHVLELAPDRVGAMRLLLQARLAAKQNEEILEDVERILELAPGDPDALMSRLIALLSLDRADEAERALAELKEAVEVLPPESPWRPRICAATATFTLERGDNDAAEAVWNDCLEEFPAAEIVVHGAIEFFVKRSDRGRSLEILRRAHEAEPTHLRFVEMLANQYGALGRDEEAVQLLRDATRDGANESDAWLALARYHEARDETSEARDAMAQALGMMDEVPAELTAAYVDLLIRAGDLDEAEEFLVRVETSPVMLNMLRGRLFLARGEPARALAALEEGLRLWPDHSVARWLAGTAAEQLGDYDRALQEYGEAVRNDPGNRDAVLSQLRLFDAHGLLQEALATLGRYRGENPRDPEMLVLAIRFAHRAGLPQVVQGALERLAAIPGQRGVAAAEFAAIRATQDGPQAGVEAIRSARLDLTRPANAPALVLLVQYLGAAGRQEEALEATEAALEAHPEAPGFHELAGVALRGAGDSDAARKEFQRALELEPERATALAQLAMLEVERGEPEAAIEFYDRAARTDPEDPTFRWAAVQLVANSGDEAELESRIEALLARHGTHAAAALLLAQRMSSRDPERAFQLARRAVRFGGGPDALDTLGRMQLERGEAERAAQTLERSVELRPESASAHYWLGRAWAAAGDEDAARRALDVALAAEVFPEREAALAERARLNAPH